MNREKLLPCGVFAGLVAVAVTVRLLTSVPNFGAVTAATLFAGFYFRHRAAAILVPLLSLVVSDYFLGGYSKGVMLAVYSATLAPLVWRAVLRRDLTATRVGLGAIYSSVVFYLVTNAAVWYAWYPHSWQGVTVCYGNALPFFAYSLLSDLLFSAGFFTVYAVAAGQARAAVARLAPASA